MIINYKNIHNETLYNLFVNNYSENKNYTPEYQYNIILKQCDYYFTIYDDKNNIIASCSVSCENNSIYEINDVYVEEEYRGNNYSVLLIMNVLYYFEQNSNNLMIKITSFLDSDAYHCYKKVFGNEYNKDNKYAYFQMQIKN